MPKKSRNIKITDRKKAWNRRPTKKLSHPSENGKKGKRFLIVCEGQNTEPLYFKSTLPY